jgi:hypothetical protein
MSTQTLLDPPEEPSWRPLLVVVSSVAALVLIVAVSLNLGEHPKQAGEASAAAGSTAAFGEGTAPPIGGLAERYRDEAAAAAQPPLTVFPVDSEEHHAAHGAQVLRAMAGEASEVRTDGHPAMTVVDLRAPAAPGSLASTVTVTPSAPREAQPARP